MNEINNYKEKEKKINFLINKVTFMKFYDFGKFREFIFINLRKHFIEIMKKEIVDELLNATNNDENKTKKKRKKRRKKIKIIIRIIILIYALMKIIFLPMMNTKIIV